MNCPLCVDVHLDVTHRHGIEVDVCPRCRGIWLDRGELDRLVADRSIGPGSDDGNRSETPDRDRSAGDGSRRSGTGRQRPRRLSDRLGELLEDVLDL